MLEQTVSIERYAIMGAGVFIILALLLIVIGTFLAKRRKIRKAKKAEKKQAKMQKQDKKKAKVKKTKKQAKKMKKTQQIEEYKEQNLRNEEIIKNVPHDIEAMQEVEVQERELIQPQEAYEQKGIEKEEKEEVSTLNQMPRQPQMILDEEEKASIEHRLELMPLGNIENKETLVVPFLEQVRIGRIKERNDLVIKSDLTVSSKHCKVYRQEGIIYIIDLNSTNGTRVNGKLIHHPEPLESGDEVHIGQIAYKVIIH